jgi:integrase
MTVGKDGVDWDDPVLQRWLGGMSNEKTVKSYKVSYRLFALYTGKTASKLIDEAIEDFKRDPRERQDIVLKRLIGFYNWLKNDYVKKLGKYKGKKGTTGRSAQLGVNIMRSFYATYDIVVKMKGKNKLPRSKVENKRIIFKPEDVWKVKVLVDNARTPRDRAIVLCHFQGGMDVSTLCSLDYGDIAEGLAKSEEPLRIQVMRVKTGIEFYTFIAKDAITALKAYLADMQSRGVKFDNRTPLFLQDRGKKRLRTTNICEMMKVLVVRSGFVSEGNNGNDFNPLGTHSLRESFGSLMINSGVPDTIVDFWLGHEIGEMAEAYKTVQYDSLRKMYMEREQLISINTPNKEGERLKEIESVTTDLAVKLKRTESELAQQKEEIIKSQNDYKSVKSTLDLIVKYVNLSDVVETESDAQRLLDFMEKMRYEKYVKEKVEQSKNNA